MALIRLGSQLSSQLTMPRASRPRQSMAQLSIATAFISMPSISKLSVYASLAILSACGGGGGGSSAPSPTPPPVNQNVAPTLTALDDVEVIEGSASVVTVSASDADGDTLTFSLSGSDGSRFSVSTSGEVSFSQAPDFESPADGNSDNVYEITVSVSDPSNASDSKSFVVTVLDALDGRVVDGPIRDAQVELAATNLAVAQTVTTDDQGYFNFGETAAVTGQQVVVSGGTDTFTGTSLPDSVFVGAVGEGEGQLAQVNALTTVLVEAADVEPTQVLSGLSVAYTADEIRRQDIWDLAQSNDEVAVQAQRVNFQLAVLFAAVRNIVGDAATPLTVTAAVADQVVALTVSSDTALSLAKPETLTALISESLIALGANLPDAPVMQSFVNSLADLNTVLSDTGIQPTSSLARNVNSEVQTAYQASVTALATDNDVSAFEAAASLSALFAGIDVDGEATDSDNDGLSDVLDADDDNDTVRDGEDAFPTDATESADTDGDGVGDNSDAFPTNANETADSDGDGVGDNADVFPDDATETRDSDGDGVGDNADAFPQDASEARDTDGDGIGDNADAFPNDASETKDSDGDGVGDNADAFPNDPNETLDSDGDGVGDNADVFPNNPAETADSDGDGVGDNADAFPSDPNETVDTDGDGVGNNADEDDDGDGVNDEDDAAPLDPDVSGFFVSGQLRITPDVVLDSDTNNPNNAFERNNIVGDFSPDAATAQPLVSPFILHGYVNKPNAGAAGPLQVEGDDDDFFIVDALAGQRFILEIPDDAQDLDFYLFNEDGAIVDVSENPPGFVDAEGFQEILIAPTAGRYFLNVYAYSFDGFPTASNYTVTTDFKGEPGAQRAVRAGEVIVSLKGGADKSEVQRSRAFGNVAARHNLQLASKSKGKVRLFRADDKASRLVKQAPHAKFGALATPRLRELSKVAHRVKALAADSEVALAEPNYMHYRHATTDDPLLDQMWHLEQVNTAAAWDTTTGAPEVVVAVIDAGNLAQHPDFIGQTTEGYDFVSATDNYDGDGIDPDPEDATPLFDECAQAATFYHGAHIAGTIGATGNNAEGIAGLSYNATLMHLRALDGDCGGSTYDIYQALLYAIGAENDSGTVPNNPASVVNMSLGGGGAASLFQDAVNQAAAQGVIVVASSGNEGASTVSYPAAYDNAFAIGATGLDGTVASYSNQGPKLDLVAPGGGGGGGVLSLNKVEDAQGNPDLTYTSAQGTSMSSPHAAAIFALMKSVHPSLTPSRLQDLLAAGVLTDDINDPGFDNASGWGLLKADKAVEVAVADANGTFVMPARLLLSTGQLYFGGATTTTTISATNPGEVALELTTVDIPVSWLTVTERTDESGDEVARWDVSVDRTDLPSGFYTTTVTFNAVDEESNTLLSRLNVSLRVGKASGGDAGAVNVVVTDSESGSVVASSITSASDDYEYSVGLPSPGSYQITASTDTNGDTVLCENGEACGRLGGLETPQTLEVSAGQSNLDITVLLPAEQ